MIGKAFLKYIFFIALLPLIVACATPGSPQGGPQDKTPPKAEAYDPPYLSKNFSAKNINILFDEWIQVLNPKQQIIISPPIDPLPEFIARKNELLIKFKNALQPNTTYSIFFGESVKDNNEGNLATNLRYVFSTGDYIDSLSISGKVRTLDGKPIPENTYVQLYSSKDDSVIVKEKPSYIYKVSKEGNFTIEYLPHDTFKLFVLNDLNTNYLYDLPTEWIGKYKKDIILDSNVSNLELPIILPESDDYKILDFNSTLNNNFLSIKLNKYYNPSKDTILLQNLNPGMLIKYPSYYTTDKVNYFILSDSNSINCVLYFNGNIIDTLRLRRPPVAAQNAVFKPTGQATEKDSILSALENSPFSFSSSLPVKSIDSSRILVMQGEDTIKGYTVTVSDSIWGIDVRVELKPKLTYQLIFSDSAILYQNGLYSDSTGFLLEKGVPDHYGSFSFNIRLPSADTSYLVSVRTESGIRIFETIVRGDTLLKYRSPSLKGGSYLVEVVEDLNNSGTWNGAAFWNFRAPEKVFRSEAYAVKPNWENEYDIQVTFNREQVPLTEPDIELTSNAPVNKSRNANAQAGSNTVFPVNQNNSSTKLKK